MIRFLLSCLYLEVACLKPGMDDLESGEANEVLGWAWYLESIRPGAEAA